MRMGHLSINPYEDSKYTIKWLFKNLKTCRIDRNYKDEYGLVHNKAIFVKLPFADNPDTWFGYAANDEGWISICDVTGGNSIESLPEVSILDGILEVEEDVNKWLKENWY